MLLVLFRYLKQHVVQQLEDGEAQVGEKEQQKKEPVVVKTEEQETQLALVVLNSDSKNKEN